MHEGEKVLTNDIGVGSEKTGCDNITSCYMSIHLVVITVIGFIWNVIHFILSLFAGYIELFWYPFMEKGVGYLRPCSVSSEL